MSVTRWLFAIAAGVVLLGGLSFLIADGLKRKAAYDAESKLRKRRTWDLTNNDPAYWKEWSDQRNYYLNKGVASGLLNTIRDNLPPRLPTTAADFLTEFNRRDFKRRLFIERLDINEFEKVNQDFLDHLPLVSLEDRLKYEEYPDLLAEHSNRHKYDLEQTTLKLHDQWNQHYRELDHGFTDWDSSPMPHEPRLFRSRRHQALETLHREGLRAFANVMGFGFDRIPEINHFDLRIYESAEYVQLPQVHYPADVTEKVGFENLSWDYANTMHLAFYHQFGRDDAYVPKFRQAAGFQPHAASDTLNWRFDMNKPIEGPSWYVARMELVSLIKHQSPAVYISDMLPNMNQLASGKTRPLDEFESDALAKIYDGEFIVLQKPSTQIRMVGAVHAGESCTECHAVKTGELLGAFSYTLRHP